jgi:hypothetical protein
MDFQLRINSADNYHNDLTLIRNSIKVNGNLAKCYIIKVLYSDDINIDLHMNFALEQDSQKPPVKASLNLLGFINKNEIEYQFNINPFPCDDFSEKAIKLKTDGSYKNLGYLMDLPKISTSNLIDSITFLSEYVKENKESKTFYEAIAKMSIITSEAIRFSSVESGIKEILENNLEFTPNSFEIIGWGGHSIAS